MILEIGRRYRLRNGLVTGPLRFDADCGTSYKFEATVYEPPHKTPSIMCWLNSGSSLLRDREMTKDIVEIIRDDLPKHCKNEEVESICDGCEFKDYEMVSHPGGESTQQVESYYCIKDVWKDEF